MKVIGPLFLDELRDEFAKLSADRGTAKRAKLLAFQEKLAGLNFIDPACGCGNFIVVTYRELRKLEQALLEQVYTSRQMGMFEVESLSQVKLGQFYGIELEEFPAHIAEVAIWMTEHLANIELGRVFGKVFADIPLHDGATIHHGDALEVDWNDVLPAEQCFAVMGNPPFIGAKYQTPEQRQRVREIADLGGSGGTLDFVAAWFLKAGGYVNSHTPSPDPLPQEERASHPIRIGFVSTNSITQGEQVAQLWPVLFDRYGLEISFAHRTFAWGSDARGKAHVHVVIIGLGHGDYEPKEKRLFSYHAVNGEPDETRYQSITAYLFGLESSEHAHRVVKESGRPLNGLAKLITGSKPLDGGHLVLTDEEKDEIAVHDPDFLSCLAPYQGAHEFINGYVRWVINTPRISPGQLRKSAEVRRRLEATKIWRASRTSKTTLGLAEFPSQWHIEVIPQQPFLAVPNTSSERREYAPIGWISPPTIPNQKLRVNVDATIFEFGLLTSKMHMSWLSHIGGRMKSDYSYSSGLVYNTFPWPDASDTQRTEIESLAQAVLDARDNYPDGSLADLYDPDTMPPDLRRAHRALDKAVDRLYRKKPFDSDRERVEHLFGLYEKLVNPLSDAEKQNKRTARNRKRKTDA